MGWASVPGQTLPSRKLPPWAESSQNSKLRKDAGAGQRQEREMEGEFYESTGSAEPLLVALPVEQTPCLRVAMLSRSP